MMRDSFSSVLIASLIFLSFFTAPVYPVPITARIVAPNGVQPGSVMDIAIVMSSPRQLGGLDLTIRYNDSLFSFLGVVRDTGLNKWEYFASSHDADSNTINIFTIADTPNGPNHPDSADFHPKGQIARYSFYVAPNWLDSSDQAFSFYWDNCSDNAASDKSGFTLLMADRTYSADGSLLWMETDSINYPEENRIPNVGVPDSCLVGVGLVEFALELSNGSAGNYYICGDPNSDGSTNISDAVFTIAYIFAGGPAPSPLASGDVNCDATVNVSDAVYLIAYIFAGGPPPCDCP